MEHTVNLDHCSMSLRSLPDAVAISGKVRRSSVIEIYNHSLLGVKPVMATYDLTDDREDNERRQIDAQKDAVKFAAAVELVRFYRYCDNGPGEKIWDMLKEAVEPLALASR